MGYIIFWLVFLLHILMAIVCLALVVHLWSRKEDRGFSLALGFVFIPLGFGFLSLVSGLASLGLSRCSTRWTGCIGGWWCQPFWFREFTPFVGVFGGCCY